MVSATHWGLGGVYQSISGTNAEALATLLMPFKFLTNTEPFGSFFFLVCQCDWVEGGIQEHFGQTKLTVDCKQVLKYRENFSIRETR